MNPFCDLGRERKIAGRESEETNQYSANWGEEFTTEGTEGHRGKAIRLAEAPLLAKDARNGAP